MIVVEQHKMFNNTTMAPHGHPEIWASTILFCSMMLGFLMIFGFVFNMSFVVMMCHGRFAAKIRHLLYMNLIFVDIMLCLVWMPMKLSIVHTLFYYYNHRNLDHILAELNIYILMMSVAFLSVVFVCIQKICQRTDILKMKQNGILVTISLSLTWIISFIWMVVQNFVHGEVGTYYLVSENSTATVQFYGKVHNDNTETVFTIVMLLMLSIGLSGLLMFAWKYRCKKTLYAPEIRIESIGPSTQEEPSRGMSISTNRNPSISTTTDVLSEPRNSLRTASFSTTTDMLAVSSGTGTRNTSFSTTTTDLLCPDPPAIVVTAPPGHSHAPGGPKARHLSLSKMDTGEPPSPTKLRQSIIYVQETRPLEIERHGRGERRLSAISTLPVITSEPLETTPKAVYYKHCPKYMDPTTYDYVQKWSVDVMALQSQLSNPVMHGGNYPYEEGHSVTLSPSPRASLDPNNPFGHPNPHRYAQRPSKADTGFHSLDSISVVEVASSERQPSISPSVQEHTITYPFPKSPDTPNLTNRKKTVQELRCCMTLLLTFLILLLPPLVLNLFQWQMDKSVYLNLHMWFVTLGGSQVLIHPFLITKMERSFKTYCLKCKQKFPNCQKHEIEHT
ncbi:uncharacterized protein LOC135493514 [Lineus longissimus]|uniref:uncharacterized protein LOC135493514 n=1 Tax=Lineus longissimus TaxID=88925 RepID=UPI002B4D9085